MVTYTWINEAVPFSIVSLKLIRLRKVLSGIPVWDVQSVCIYSRVSKVHPTIVYLFRRHQLRDKFDLLDSLLRWSYYYDFGSEVLKLYKIDERRWV